MIKLARAEQADEMLLMGLRLSEGIDLGRLESLGNMRLDPEVVDELVGLGLLQVSNAQGFDDAVSTNWRANELEAIVACAGPGLRPGVPKPQSRAVRIRATPSGRLVLNAVVAKLAKSFEASRGMDNLVSAR